MEGEHMRLHFTKMEGLGNDYVYVNCFKEKVEHPSELAVRVSDRHFGIGSDGLILIKPSEVADFKMDMYNADGTQSEMCGNGIRCVGKYVYDYGLTDKTSVSIETLAGIKYLEFTLGDEEKNGRKTVFLCLVLCQRPWHGLIDIFVASAENVEDLSDGISHTKLIHLIIDLLHLV